MLMGNNLNRMLLLVILVTTTLAILIANIFADSISLNKLDDFTVMWGPTKLLLDGTNPYNQSTLRNLLVPIGWPPDQRILPAFHPPISFSLSIPFAVLDYQSARLVWLLFQIGLVLASILLSIEAFGVSSNRRPILMAIAICTFPSLRLFACGQISAVLLFGLASYFYCSSKDRHFESGFGLSLLLVKPQLLILFLLLLFFKALRTRIFAPLFGMMIGALLLSLPALALDRSVFAEWLAFVSTNPPNIWATPTFGTVLRIIFGQNHFWLQFAPMILGIGWISYLSWPNGSEWNWLSLEMFSIAASLMLASYAWEYDYVLLLTALPYALSFGIRLRSITYLCIAVTLTGIVFQAFLPPWCLVWLGVVGMLAVHSVERMKITSKL